MRLYALVGICAATLGLGLGCGGTPGSVGSCSELKALGSILEAKLSGCSATNLKAQLVAQGVELAAACGVLGVRCGEESTALFDVFRGCVSALKECRSSPLGEVTALTELLTGYQHCSENLAAELKQIQLSCH